jgi:hypothetical protein
VAAADVVKVGGGPGGEHFDQLGVQRHVAVVVELAQRDAQPVASADLYDRVGLQVRELAGAHPGAGQQFEREPVAGSLLAQAAVISLAASRSPGNFGSGTGPFGCPRR